MQGLFTPHSTIQVIFILQKQPVKKQMAHNVMEYGADISIYTDMSAREMQWKINLSDAVITSLAESLTPELELLPSCFILGHKCPENWI